MTEEQQPPSMQPREAFSAEPRDIFGTEPDDMSDTDDSVYFEPCQEAIATLYSFLDGELTPDRREQIQNHLEECGPCFEAFDFEAELKALIARKCRDEVPEALRRRVAEALRAEDVRS
jgi:mycothiol system anti-sigma-R factor